MRCGLPWGTLWAGFMLSKTDGWQVHPIPGAGVTLGRAGPAKWGVSRVCRKGRGARDCDQTRTWWMRAGGGGQKWRRREAWGQD